MNPDPADRYHSASGVAEAVQRWLAEEPVASYRSLVGRLEGWPARSPTSSNTGRSWPATA